MSPRGFVAEGLNRQSILYDVRTDQEASRNPCCAALTLSAARKNVSG
jgi:hypothetical protein